MALLPLGPVCLARCPPARKAPADRGQQTQAGGGDRYSQVSKRKVGVKMNFEI